MHHSGNIMPRECASVPCRCLKFEEEGETRAPLAHDMSLAQARMDDAWFRRAVPPAAP
jgi:hypothetical protein